MAAEIMEEYPDRITEVFVGKNIFITGGTGFVGKVFLEKILRQCPNIGCIFLLIREKKGRQAHTRLTEYFNSPLFDALKSLRGNDILKKKCKIITGDVAQKNLGIATEDREFLIENIHYIYHLAATVKFDEPIRNALLLNTRGTKYVLDLAKECKHLEFLCHMSTAYVQPSVKILEENIYPPPANPNEILNVVENLPADIMDSIESKLLGDLPNTYTYTKALSEALVSEQMDNLPVVIVRPSVVIPIWKEPTPGWGDTINGPVGMLIAGGKGILRTMYVNKSYYADFMPVDIVANTLAMVTWDYLSTKERRIFNFVTSDEIHKTWKELIDMGLLLTRTKMPFNYVPWYPGGDITSSKLLHYMRLIFTQIIPSIFIDILLYCLGYKPFLCHIQRRIINGYQLLGHYTNNQWLFTKKNVTAIRDKMNPRELKAYICTKEDFTFEEYFTNMFHGARLYILKESDESLPAARRHMKIMYAVDIIFKVILILGIFYFLYNWFC